MIPHLARKTYNLLWPGFSIYNKWWDKSWHLLNSPMAFHLIQIKAQVLSRVTMASLLLFEYASSTPVSETLCSLFHQAETVFQQMSVELTSYLLMLLLKSHFVIKAFLEYLFKMESIPPTKLWSSLFFFFFPFFHSIYKHLTYFTIYLLPISTSPNSTI